MSDILMIARPGAVAIKPGPFPTKFLAINEFFTDESLVQAHDTVLWRAFHTHGKYARITRHAEYVVVALDRKGKYRASALVVPVGAKWLVEYVMADPRQQNQGAGTSVMARIMHEAKRHKISWVILNCDPWKEKGKLPAFYQKFGFKMVA